MGYRWLIIGAFAIFALSVNEPGLAQPEPDRIIAGDHLSKLWDALKAGSVSISNAELHSQIAGRKLSAILIPNSQPQNTRVVKRCFKEKTIFDVPDLTVSQDDYAQLIKYAKDGVFQKAGEIRASLSVHDEAGLVVAKGNLLVEINSRPVSERNATKRFVGALLAESEPTDPELAGYVQAYREHVEKSAIAQLKALEALWLSPRTPYSWGSSDFSGIDLRKVNPSAVGEFTLGDKIFRRTWVGPTYILVYQGTSPTPRDPSGLGLSKDWGVDRADAAAFIAPQLKFKM